MVDKRLEFGLLGPLEMSVDGALVPPGTPKQRAVLAMLLMNRNSPVGVDRLITALWADSPPSGARASIHSYVSNLRKLLSGVGLDPRMVLAAAPPGYRLSIPDNACDIGRFIAEKTAGVHAAAASRFEQAGKHLSAALTEWRGPVLEDLRDFAFADKWATALTGDKLIAQTAFALKPGQISEVVQTDMGLHLVLVTERKPGMPSNFEQIKEDVRMFCIMEMQQNIINHMRKNAKIEKGL